MLERALAEDPDNVDVQVALAALLMRGVQMVWLSPAEREPAETAASVRGNHDGRHAVRAGAPARAYSS